MTIRVEIKREDGHKVIRDCMIGPGIIKALREEGGSRTWRGKKLHDEVAHQAQKMARECLAGLTLLDDGGSRMADHEATLRYGDATALDYQERGPLMVDTDV